MNFIINNLFLISIVLAAGFMLLLPTLQRRGPHINPFQVTQKMNAGKVLILDVRNQEEYDAGHVRGAMLIPAEDLPNKLARIEKFKLEPIVIVCASGSRAARATTQLKKAGFKDVSSLEGGMKAWVEQGMPVETGEKAKEKPAAKKKGK